MRLWWLLVGLAGLVSPLMAAPPPGHPTLQQAASRIGLDQPAQLSERGEVLQTIDSNSYTYIRLRRPDASEIWLAAPRLSLSPGQQIRYAPGVLMQNFFSKKHRRTFAQIWFVGPVQLIDTEQEAAIERGRYIFHVAGCKECHTQVEGALLAGGRALETPYGVFYSPNITPHPEHGIGRWSAADLQRALHQGEAPDGGDYYPVFPYPSYAGMQEQDIADLWRYLQTVPPVDRPNRAHELAFPFSWRSVMWGWKLLFFDSVEFQSDSSQSPQWNRGAYLVRALGHCGECHTPRNRFGVLDSERELAGTDQGPEGSVVPNITPDPNTGIGGWSEADLDALLEMGMLPDADFVGSRMADVVDNSTAYLTEEDRQAMIVYLRSLQPIHNEVE